jgi:hypothetical protein
LLRYPPGTTFSVASPLSPNTKFCHSDVFTFGCRKGLANLWVGAPLSYSFP